MTQTMIERFKAAVSARDCGVTPAPDCETDRKIGKTTAFYVRQYGHKKVWVNDRTARKRVWQIEVSQPNGKLRREFANMREAVDFLCSLNR